ncbi:glycosyltransferase family 2 protein [Catalinimonas sp. 4WD22]|uniref:glycosyltransferase family 2 protein n=1 Tax=Catalinimonas locisalis TaxID=3133978 RepID=UPI00310125A9
MLKNKMVDSLIVLIATAGGETHLKETLKSLSACVKPSEYKKTIIVENGPRGNVETLVYSYKDTLHTEYFYSAIPNKSAALNFGLQYIPEQTLVFFTDDDVIFSEQLLVEYIQAANKLDNNNRYFFGGPTFPKYEKEPPKWIKSSLPPSARGYTYQKAKFKESLFLGFNWAAYARDIKELGGFDPNFGPGTVPKRTGQETDMQNRLLNKGLKEIYVPHAEIWHYVPAERIKLKWLLKRKLQGGISRGLRQYPNSKSKLIPFAFFRELLVNLIYLFFSIFSSREKKVIALSDVVVSIGKIKGFYSYKSFMTYNENTDYQ